MSYATITTGQAVDFLYKKLGFGVAKTDNSARAASSEGNASPFLTLGSAVYQQDYLIPTYTSFAAMIAGGNSTTAGQTITNVRTVQATNNPGSVSQATWMTNLTDWIPVAVGGQGYQIGVFAGPPGLNISSLQGSGANAGGPPRTVAVPINGVSSDSWFFDYQSGILNFVDLAVPATVANTSNVVYVVGSTYSGSKGVTTWSNMSIANLTVTGNTISTRHYGNIFADTITPYQTTVTTFNSSTAIGLPTGGNVGRPSSPSAGQIRYNSDYNSVEFYNGTGWVNVITNIAGQNFYGDGTNATYTLNQTTTSNGVLVSINGTVQQPVYAYNVVGNQIIFTEIPLSTDQIDVRFLAASVTVDNLFNVDVSVTGNVTITGLYSSPQVTKASNATGTVGQICWDANYIYVCTATNTWKRSPLTGGY